MRLSDSFEVAVEEPALELKVVQLNIHSGHNEELMQRCPLLKQYAQYVERVQKYVQDFPLTEAVELAVKECISEGILAEFLLKHRSEAIEMNIFEYDEKRELELLRKAEREVGREEGRDIMLRELISKKLQKGRTVQQISEELEVTVEEIMKICASLCQNESNELSAQKQI